MSATSPAPLSVTSLTRQIREMLEANFDQVACVGEVSNLVRARSGHVYFTLKDENAQISAVMWKTRAQRLKFDLQDGLELVVIGPVEVYPPRGSYQLIVEQAFPQGVGPLELAFRQMQEKLAAEGLFDPERKRPLPQFPRRIALVTSSTGAAVRDMLQVLTRRWKLSDLVIIPVAVQGANAAPQIAEGISLAGQIPEVDVIITGRGGGSLEDLWAFNEEVVARAIVNSAVPVISAVGHEIDVSISDLVADRRALTPTEAAEFVVPNQAELTSFLNDASLRMTHSLKQRASSLRQRLDSYAERRIFQRPEELLATPRRSIDELESRLQRVIREKHRFATQQLQSLSGQMEALSPLKVLGRGYSMTSDPKSGSLIRKTADVQPGQHISTQLSDGKVTSQVLEIEES